MEQWKSILDGRYEISSHGRARRADSQRLLKPRIGKRGYAYFHVLESGKRRTIHVHKYVALAFLGPRPDGFQINHKDSNKVNNFADNLEYVTPSENKRHSVRSGTTKTGASHVNAKLTEQQIKEIRSLWQPSIQGRHNQFGYSRLARQFGVHQSTIWRVCQGIYYRN